MKQLQHVVWSKGTFLTPQHLQVQDKYVEDLLQFQMESCGSHLWGFCRLQIDIKKLVEGQVCVLGAKGILPDGMLFDIPDADPAPASRTLDAAFKAGQQYLDVFLSVPEHRSNGINMGLGVEVKTRFVGEPRIVRDENSGATEKPVQVARKNLKLLFENESHEGYTVVHLARIERTAAGTFTLAQEHVPPLLDVHGSEVLRSRVRGLLETLAARSALLASGRRQRNQSLADFSASDIARFWLLYTINQHLPIFRHLFSRSTVHPEQLFTAMLSLAGALTTFSASVTPHDLPKYDHQQLGKCFADLEEKIRFLLETVVPVNFVALPLKLTQPSIYSTTIDDEAYLRDSKFYLAVNAAMEDAELVHHAPKLMKIGAAAHVEQMIRQALPGLRITYVSAPPSEIPVKLKYKYFNLELAGKPWEGIQRARNFGVYVPRDIPDPQLELIILMPQRRQNNA